MARPAATDKRGRLRAFGLRLLVIALHLALWTAAFAGAFLLRFEGNVPADYKASAAGALVVLLAARTATFYGSRLFHGLLRYTGVAEVRLIVQATTLSSLALAGSTLLLPSLRIPRSIYFGDWVLGVLVATGLRLAVRLLVEAQPTLTHSHRRAVVIGAGDAGELFLRDLTRSSHREFEVVGMLDDDPQKKGLWVRGACVLGPIDEETLREARVAKNADIAILAMPRVDGTRTRAIVDLCRRLGLEVKTIPSLAQILSGDVNITRLRPVAIEDLLKREPIKLDEAGLGLLLRGKRVLVTGGAGSIGSELARQAATHQPDTLALLDHNENGLFYLERSLKTTHPKLNLRALVGDLKDARRMRTVLEELRPHVVLHAGAHKHVPLMEENPGEAVKNNVFGTAILAELCDAHDVEIFVLISTDKAVNPTSVMGATKRVAEMCVQARSGTSRTRFVAVRFGNVLGSAGSVVPIFSEQIAAGGPVTITHPEMRRYFMTIPEAAQLVLQAAALAQGGEIFLLDMGEPVRILDLAQEMIRLSGLEPNRDIPIVVTGQRPGEKLYEELLLDTERSERTVHPKIFVGHIPPVSDDRSRDILARLRAALDASSGEVKRALQEIIPEANLGLSPPSRPRVALEEDRLRLLDTLDLSS